MTADPTSIHFRDADIRDYLHGRLPSDSAERFESHLTTCPDCRDRLDLAAAPRDCWREFESLLTDDDSDRDEPADLPSAPILLREIKGWLDPTDDPRMIGRFAGYEIVGIIGHGGMGIVLKGFESSLNRYVAVKMMAPRLATSETARLRFAREAQAAAAVLHPNVIAIHRVDQWHGLPFLVMPYLAGESLQQRLNAVGRLSPESALRIASQIADGLAAAHDQELIHRDVKPANILLDPGVERVTITDFGLARAADDSSMTRTGVIPGTPQYMSPEQAGGKPLDCRSDLFSLGSVLYTMITGEPPFQSENDHDVLYSVRNGHRRPVDAHLSDTPPWLVRLIDALHADPPDRRPQSAKQTKAWIDQCIRHLNDPDAALPPELATIPKTRWHRQPLMAAVGVLTLIALTVMALQQTRPQNPPPHGRRIPALNDTADKQPDLSLQDIQSQWESIDESIRQIEQSLRTAPEQEN